MSHYADPRETDREQIAKTSKDPNRPTKKHKDQGDSDLLVRPDRALALKKALVAFEILRAEHAMTVNPPLVSSQIFLCGDDDIFRPGDGPFGAGNVRLNLV
jgi:hypothetical protein